MDWKYLSGITAHKNPYFSVEEADVIMPDGNPSKYYIVHNRSGVGVIAYDGKKIMMVNQYRVPIRKRVWEFPAGGAEHENRLVDAKRELEEEAGLVADKWTLLGSYYINPSLNGQDTELYLAEGLNQVPHKRENSEMDMEARFFTLREVDEMIDRSELSAFGISSFYLFKKYLETKK